jgi:hypothetical protein
MNAVCGTHRWAQGGGRPDISRADFTFCLLAIDWGWGIEETAERLMVHSRKARENGEAYARLTANRAADAVARRSHGQVTGIQVTGILNPSGDHGKKRCEPPLDPENV